MTEGEVYVLSNIPKVFLILLSYAAASSLLGESTTQNIAGTYSLLQVNGKNLPAISWTGPGQGCGHENLYGIMLVDSNHRWAALIEEREVCAGSSGATSTGAAKSNIFTGTYMISDSIYEFHDETLGVTDRVKIDGDLLRYIAAGIGDFEGQTAEYVFVRER